jgi:hypothetical protein
MEGNSIMHNFYRKPMASRKLVTRNSAISMQAKRSILQEECMRRLRHMSHEIIGKEMRDNAIGFNLDMK